MYLLYNHTHSLSSLIIYIPRTTITTFTPATHCGATNFYLLWSHAFPSPTWHTETRPFFLLHSFGLQHTPYCLMSEGWGGAGSGKRFGTRKDGETRGSREEEGVGSRDKVRRKDRQEGGKRGIANTVAGKNKPVVIPRIRERLGKTLWRQLWRIMTHAHPLQRLLQE